MSIDIPEKYKIQDIVVNIKNNETGDVVEHSDYILYEDGQPPTPFMWEHGNNSCDCNRELYFFRARGFEKEHTGCSEGRFSVNIYIDGDIFYREFDEEINLNE